MAEPFAMIFEGVGKPLHRQPLQLHPPKMGEILVQIEACTICGSDRHSYYGRRVAPTPSILGHEIVGRIVEVGAGVIAPIGQRIVWSMTVHCGSCIHCMNGWPQKCVKVFKYGHERFDPVQGPSGGLATHVYLRPGTQIFPVTDQIPAEVVTPISCSLATVFAAIRACTHSVESVLILGAGMLGLNACAILQSKTLFIRDPDLRKLALAKEFGVNTQPMPAHGVDLILDMCGVPSAIESAIGDLRIGGTIVLVGSVFPGPPLQLSAEQIVRNCVTIRGMHNYAPQDIQQALQFIEDPLQQQRFQALVPVKLPLSEATQAFEIAEQRGLARVLLQGSSEAVG